MLLWVCIRLRMCLCVCYIARLINLEPIALPPAHVLFDFCIFLALTTNLKSNYQLITIELRLID